MKANKIEKKNKRDEFNTKKGFILACIGSAVGMGNIWMFPIRVHKFGGATFLIPYLLFVIIIGYTGIVEEMSFGRAFRAGPVGAFRMASETRKSHIGKYIGLIPVIGSLGIAIGYTVVVAWIIKFLSASLTGDLLNAQNSGAYFAEIAGPYGSFFWHVMAIVVCFVIMAFGISDGIEKVNKFMMPAFFGLFLLLAIRIGFLDGSKEGYQFIFKINFSELLNPKIWIYALGQAFFSLSLAGSGTLVYGSYLKDSEDAPESAKYTALFDTLAAMLAAFVIIPAIYAYNVETSGGPPLMFITMPEIFKNMYGGEIFAIVFFIAVLFAGISSLINLYETPVELMEERFKLSRPISVFIILVLGFVIGIKLEDGNILGMWMDAVSIYIIPLGALLAGLMFSWVCDKKFVLEEVSKGREKKLGDFYYIMLKYVYCGIILLVYLIGIFSGSIG